MAPSALDRICAHLRTQTAAFAGLIAEADQTLPVPTCPEWNLNRLVAHVGSSHLWAADLLARGSTAMPDLGPAAGAELPADPRDHPRWLEEATELLVGAVRRASAAHAEVWTFIGPRPPVFWARRMLCDLVVHRADAALALGRPYDLPADLASDAIGEGLDLIAAGSRAGTTPALAALRGDGERLLFAATDTGTGGDRRLVHRRDSGVTWEAAAPGAEADVTVEGRAVDLLLVLTRRRPPAPDLVKVTGDGDLLRHWLDHTAF